MDGPASDVNVEVNCLGSEFLALGACVDLEGITRSRLRVVGTINTRENKMRLRTGSQLVSASQRLRRREERARRQVRQRRKAELVESLYTYLEMPLQYW